MSDQQASFNDLDPETLERNFERHAEINKSQSETLPPVEVSETKVVNNPQISESSSVSSHIHVIPVSRLAQPKPIKVISRQERRLMEREAAKAAKRKPVPILHCILLNLAMNRQLTYSPD
jgi:diadenosine tetraphosphate (Ap4A) HIT family hydrolase